jgi:hypothetical protein
MATCAHPPDGHMCSILKFLTKIKYKISLHRNFSHISLRIQIVGITKSVEFFTKLSMSVFFSHSHIFNNFIPKTLCKKVLMRYFMFGDRVE